MSSKAVIDLGSLKMKVAIFDTDNKQLLTTDSHLVLLGKGINEHSKITESSLDKLNAALKLTAEQLKQMGVTDVAIIGTEALRRAKNIGAVHALIETHFPGHTLEVVDQHREAELFFKAVSREFPDQPIVAVDIGGGSVQVIKGVYDSTRQQAVIDKRHNLLTGTYRLQQEYSPQSDIVSGRLDEAQRHIAHAYSNVDSQAPILVFGSTCMRDFIASTGIVTFQDKNRPSHPLYVERSHIADLLQQIIQLAPKDRDHYYADGGYFMYGADFLLMNVLEAAARTGATRIYPTNLNGSYALI
ncbi:MAG TPA: hypothetical protein VJM46_03235 [Candidatus Saccharimonadales bacterium]|nr:hypothetical protein [Candidatus Saccharimonadales bacterium]